ncbi:hypothetical protein HAX54_027944 [Datura stramonium]|uniref:EGF-like domain-containing protein n=1 Tax=Datura stramonium TaxID=4076 RepID=A0ABS8V4I4_DATST|nr:hypothetical protein [Datura stramonium]
MDNVPIVLDWAIGNLTCVEAQQHKDYACLVNSQCVDSGTGLGGYRCSCDPGYEGNPYVSPGCQASLQHSTSPSADLVKSHGGSDCGAAARSAPGRLLCSLTGRLPLFFLGKPLPDLGHQASRAFFSFPAVALVAVAAARSGLHCCSRSATVAAALSLLRLTPAFLLFSVLRPLQTG